MSEVDPSPADEADSSVLLVPEKSEVKGTAPEVQET